MSVIWVAAKVMLMYMVYAVAEGHIQTCGTDEAMLMFVVHVTTEGHLEAHGLYCI